MQKTEAATNGCAGMEPKAASLSAPGGFADHKRGHLLGLDAGHIFAHTASAARIQLQIAVGQFLFFLQHFKPL